MFPPEPLWSRFLNGTLAMHEEMEAKLARFLGKEAAAVFPTGFQANLGAISALVGKSDFVVYVFEDSCGHYDLRPTTQGMRLVLLF